MAQRGQATLPWTASVWLALATACAPQLPPAERFLADHVVQLPSIGLRTPPLAPHNPFERKEAAFVAVDVEAAGLAEHAASAVVPTGGQALSGIGCPGALCLGAPAGQPVQVLISIYSKDDKGQPHKALARGRTVPFRPDDPKATAGLRAYVVANNAFAPVHSDDNAPTSKAGRVGRSAVVRPGVPNDVVLIGGANLAPSAADMFDPANYKDISTEVALYDVTTRRFKLAPVPLKVPRAFAGVAAGKSVIAVVGGFTLQDGKVKPTASIEFLDADLQVRTSTAPSPDLLDPRAGATVVALYPDEDKFLILGGRGPSDCPTCASQLWEVWSPDQGRIAFGNLGSARWNHAAVTKAEGGGGYALLVGGENAKGVHNDMLVVQWSPPGKLVVSSSGQTPDPSAGLGGEFLWTPQHFALPTPRTLPGAAIALRAATPALAAYLLLYVVGGFGDVAHQQPLDRVDVFDMQGGEFLTLPAPLQLQTPRGAPMVALAPLGPVDGQVLIAGGASGPNRAVATGEVMRAVPSAKGFKPVPTFDLQPVTNELLDGEMALGTATALVTGQILLIGGVGGKAGELLPRGKVQVWAPY